jgi:argininosuccinate lyase
VGDDYLLDGQLAIADCVASIAHAEMLHRVGLLAATELAELRQALGIALAQAEAGEFSITAADEDVHTALERFLSSQTPAGAKIHTGRSRNDQVMAALRLFGREALLAVQVETLALATALTTLAAEHPTTIMAGRTHLQPAMPSTLALWAQAFAEELLDDLLLLDTAYRLTNRSPLGSAASYGVPLPLDRQFVATALGFDSVHHNVLAASNARGKLESVTLDALEQMATTLARLSQDLILFSLAEIGYFTLPKELCTGSSIMPQKRNPDALELVRAKTATLAGYAVAVKSIVRSLPSGYSRDLQETKRPYLAGLTSAVLMARVMTVSIARLEVNEAALLRSISAPLMATDRVFDLVRSGAAFRDAYRRVAEDFARGTASGGEQAPPGAAVAERTSIGAANNLELGDTGELIAVEGARLARQRAAIGDALEALVGRPVTVYRDVEVAPA